jgi:excisionase family DNA binding protein
MTVVVSSGADVLSREDVAHLHRALAAHAAWCRTNQVTRPPGICRLEALLRDTGGHGVTTVATHPGVGDAAGHVHDEPLLCVSLDAAGARLGVSGRTVRRLVDAGELPAVRIGGSPRVRLDDLSAYVAGLVPAEPSAGVAWSPEFEEVR